MQARTLTELGSQRHDVDSPAAVAALRVASEKAATNDAFRPEAEGALGLMVSLWRWSAEMLMLRYMRQLRLMSPSSH